MHVKLLLADSPVAYPNREHRSKTNALKLYTFQEAQSYINFILILLWKFSVDVFSIKTESSVYRLDGNVLCSALFILRILFCVYMCFVFQYRYSLMVIC